MKISSRTQVRHLCWLSLSSTSSISAYLRIFVLFFMILIRDIDEFMRIVVEALLMIQVVGNDDEMLTMMIEVRFRKKDH